MDRYKIYPKQFLDSHIRPQDNSCFVVMPFSSELNNTYTTIESAAESMGIKCSRADNISTTSEPFINKICSQICQSYYIIVDITGLNSNVFYELGVAHVLRDASNVLIIKDDETECPGDIRHLHYYEYSKKNLKKLKERICDFFAENNILKDISYVLDLLGLLPSDDSLAKIFIEDLSTLLGELLSDLLLSLNGRINTIYSDRVLLLLNNLTDEAMLNNSNPELVPLYSALVLNVLSKVHQAVDLTSYLQTLFELKSKNFSKEWLAECSIIVLDNPKCFAVASSWIKSYLKSVSPAAFDLPKYTLEIGIIKSRSDYINPFLVENLCSDNETLAEHCAKLVKERKVYSSLPLLQKIISSHHNPYLVRSALDAITDMATKRDELLVVRTELNRRSSFVEQYPFIKLHIDAMDNKIKEL